MFDRPWFNLTRLWAISPSIPYLGCWRDRQPRIAARIRLGENTAIRALRSVEGMDKLGPAYLMARESAADRVNTLRMGLMLVFMDVVVVGRSVFRLLLQYVLGVGDRLFSEILE